MGSVCEVTLASLACYSSSSQSAMPVSSRYNHSSYGGRTPLYGRSTSLERSSLLASTNGIGRYRSATSSITSASSCSNSSSYSRRPPLSGSSFANSSASSSVAGTYRRRCESGSARTSCLESLGQISEARKYLNERKALDNHPSTYRQRYQRSSSKDNSISNGATSVSRSLIRIGASSSSGSNSGDQTSSSTTYRLDRMAEKIRSFESSRSSSYCRSTERIAPTEGDVSGDHSPDRIMSVNELRQRFDLLHSTANGSDSTNGKDTIRPTNGKYSPPSSQTNMVATHFDNSKSSPPHCPWRSSLTNRTNTSAENRFSKYSCLQGSSAESDEKSPIKCDSPRAIRSHSFRRSSNSMDTETTQLTSTSTKTSTSPTLEITPRFRKESNRTISPTNNDTKLSVTSVQVVRTHSSSLSNAVGIRPATRANFNTSTSSSIENNLLRSRECSPINSKSNFSALNQTRSVRSTVLSSNDYSHSEVLPSVPSISSPATETSFKLPRHATGHDRVSISTSTDTTSASRSDLESRAERIRGGRMARVSDPVGPQTTAINGSEEKTIKPVEVPRDNCASALSSVETSDSCSSLTESSDSQLSAAAAAGGKCEAAEAGDSARTLTGQHGLVGLRNIGNTCFMNAVLQCLSNTRALHPYILGSEYVGDVNSTQSTMNGALITVFSELMQEMWSDEDDEPSRALTTAPFKAEIQRFAPRFMGYQQQDAQEFLRYLLEGLHEDVNRVKERPKPILTDIGDHLSDNLKAMESWKRFLRRDDSKFVDLFVGQLKSTLRCTVCGHESVTFDPIWDLSLPLPAATGRVRLQTCFDLFTAEEVLDENEKPTCAKCEKRQKCTKSFTIHRFPRILVVHLKRFNPAERYRGKLNSVVELPLCGLDLSHYSSGHTPCKYNLYGIANHSGTLYSGHYTASCRHPYSGDWNQYNDSRVSELPISSVITKEAYVMFFELSVPRAEI